MHLSFFPSLFEKPTKIRFTQQEHDETIELFLRMHWVTNIPWLVISIFGFFFPAILIFVDTSLNLGLINRIPPQLLTPGIVIFYMLLTGYVIESFLFWYFNIYIVTNQHIVDINFHSLLSRDVLEIKLHDVQGVNSEINGIVRSLFNFGHVIVKTAAEQQIVSFVNVPKPDLVVDRIQDLRGNMP